MAFMCALPLRSAYTSQRRNRALCAMSGNAPRFDPSVYVITDRTLAGTRGVVATVEAALRGDGKGNRSKLIQLRDKTASASESLQLGRTLLNLTRTTGAHLIINDNVKLAVALNADGVHLGQEDSSASLARPLVRILGVSASTTEEAERAIADGADYIGVGPVFGTKTKEDARDAMGLSTFADIVRIVHGRIPVIAIGGVSAANAGECAAAGAGGVAVVSAVMTAEDPARATADIAVRVAAGRATRAGT